MTDGEKILGFDSDGYICGGSDGAERKRVH